MSMVKTIVEDRRAAKKAQSQIDIANKKAMLAEAESAKLYAENELLKSQIKLLKQQSEKDIFDL